MSADDGERALLDQALRAMDGCARRLAYSRAKLKALFPLDRGRLMALGADDEEAVDAFLKRYEQLVATIQDQVFTGIALAEAEDIRAMSRRDVTELMERLGAIPSAAGFRRLALVRNRLAHVYPDDPVRQAENLNAAYTGADALLAAAERLRAFCAARPELGR